MTNPYQEPAPESLSFPEAVRVIAERTAFRTEEDSARVLAAVDAEVERVTAKAEADHNDQIEPGDPEPPAPPAPPVKATARKS